MTLRKRWINLVHRAASGTKRARTLLTPVGVIIFTTFSASFVWAAVWVDGLLKLPALFPDPARLPVSIPLMVLGGGIAVWSAFHFLRVRGTPVPFNPPPELVATGPYRCARNPMLSGVFLLLFGIGCFANSFSLVFVFTPLFVLVNVWELKEIEEPELVKRLGADYLEYRNRTPMFIPRIRGCRE